MDRKNFVPIRSADHLREMAKRQKSYRCINEKKNKPGLKNVHGKNSANS